MATGRRGPSSLLFDPLTLNQLSTSTHNLNLFISFPSNSNLIFYIYFFILHENQHRNELEDDKENRKHNNVIRLAMLPIFFAIHRFCTDQRNKLLDNLISKVNKGLTVNSNYIIYSIIKSIKIRNHLYSESF